MAGISVNASSLTTAAGSLTYAQGMRDVGNGLGSSFISPTAKAVWEGVLNPGDIVRPHSNSGASNSVSNSEQTYFEIEFLGWVN